MVTFNMICVIAEIDQETDFKNFPITYPDLVEANLLTYLVFFDEEWNHFDIWTEQLN